MKYIKRSYISLIIIFILSLIPLIWFKGNCVIAGGDNNLYMSVLKLVRNNLYYLNEENMGQNNFGWKALIPSMGAFWWLLKSIRLEDHIIQRFWLMFIWFFSMCGMYLLIKEITKEKFSEIGGILGASLYMINIFNGSLAISLLVNLTFLALPYLILVTIRAVKHPREEKLNILYFGIIIFFVSIILPNPGYSYILFLLPVLYILYSMFYFLNLKIILRKLMLIIKIFLVSAFSTSFFTLAYLYSVRDTFGKWQTLVQGSFFGSNSLQEAFRFLAPWAFMASHYKMPYNPWAHHYYESPWIIFAAYLIPIMVFAGLIFQKRFKKDILFFCMVFFLGLFLAKGIGSPFGKLYQWAFDHIPLFTAFREPWSKFTQITVFSFSIILGIGFSEIKQNIYNSKLRKIVISAFSSITICCIVIAAFPIFTSEIFSTYWNGSVKGNYIKVPDYWNRTAEYLRQKGSSNTVFLTPRSQLSIYEWNMGVSTMGNIPSVILDNPVISYNERSFFGKEIIALVYGLIEPESSYKFSKLLKLMGVRYVLQQNDMDWRFLPHYTYPPGIMRNILEQQPGLKKVNSIGKLDIYKIPKGNCLPEIYIADNNTLVYGDIKEMQKLLFTDFLDKRPLIKFQSSYSTKDGTDIYNNIVHVAEEGSIKDITKKATLIYNFDEKKSKTIAVPEGKYSIKLAYEPRLQKQIISNIDEKTIVPAEPKNSRIKFLQLNLINPEKEMPVFSLKPVLANWEYETFFYQPAEKKLILENFNDKTVNVDLFIGFEYYWKGTVKVFDGNTNRFIKGNLLSDFSDFIDIKDISVKPGKNYFKVMCIPAKTEKNWSGEKVNVRRDVGVKISGRKQPLKEKSNIGDKLILETDYKLTVFNGIKQIDLLFYLDSDNDQEIDAWMQITVDDWLRNRDYCHFQIDLKEALQERLNNTNYKILAAFMVCYPSQGGEAEETESKIEGNVILKNLSITHFYCSPYKIFQTYLKSNFNILNPLKDFPYTQFKIISDTGCYPFIIELEGVEVQNKEKEINLSEDNIVNLKWIMLAPERGSADQRKSFGTVKSIEKINSVMYRIELEASNPCFIVFSKNFHPKWKAFIQSRKDKNSFLDKSVFLTYIKNKLLHRRELGNHIEVNGFSNAWHLDSRDVEELKNNDKEIIIVFYPQILQEIGTIITSLFLIAALTYIISLKIRK